MAVPYIFSNCATSCLILRLLRVTLQPTPHLPHQLPHSSLQCNMTSILITGCTAGGLGFEAATQILRSFDILTTLILTVRTLTAQEKVISAIRPQNESYLAHVTVTRVKLLELSSLSSVRSFCNEIDTTRIHTILSNAGTMENTTSSPRMVTKCSSKSTT